MVRSRFVSLERDVLVLSFAMFCFSLGFQMTGRYMSRYLSVLGAGALVIGLYGSFGNVISAVYPYPGGAFSDRFGTRNSLTLFGLVSTLGFVVWLVAPSLELGFAGFVLPSWTWVFVGLLLAQAWKSLGLGATFALVRQSVEAGELATGFASTETFRRLAFLVGYVAAAVVLAFAAGFVVGFRYILAVAVVFAAFGTVVQHFLYEPEGGLGKEFEGLERVLDDVRGLPREVRGLLVADTTVRFANGMVYPFFVIVVTELFRVDATVLGFYLNPDAFFGVVIAIEMVVALLVMAPSARIADTYSRKSVVATGFLVYAVFPVVLISSPADPLVIAAVFAVSGLRFAGLPAHKALIVGPADESEGGTVTGSYYLVRNTVVMPSSVLGGALYWISPALAFGTATVVGLAGTAYFVAFGHEF